MNYRMIVRLICYILRVEAVCLLPSLGISLFTKEWASAAGVGVTIGLAALLSLVSFLWKPQDKQISAREGFLSVALCWVAVSVVGALPFFFSGAIPNFIDCLFETVSGFTTTGASILTDIESLPMGILYWRSFTHWLGGM
ncbi:MAG: TrkH family potassium uptake protein, partial [Acutalibacter sp.]|nr:TrkH family potassium uptake protein [Acutalibacter sp.]